MEVWQWVLAGVVAWYAVAAVLIRQCSVQVADSRGSSIEYEVRVFAWLVSPVAVLVVPMLVLALLAAQFGRYALTPKK